MTSAEDTSPDDLSSGDASPEDAPADGTSPADAPTADASAADTLAAEASAGGTSAEDIARWMLETIRTEGRLDQDDAVRLVPEKFGPEWVRTSPNGHPALDREIVKAFRSAHDGTVQWDRDRRFWSPKR